MTLYST